MGGSAQSDGGGNSNDTTETQQSTADKEQADKAGEDKLGGKKYKVKITRTYRDPVASCYGQCADYEIEVFDADTGGLVTGSEAASVLNSIFGISSAYAADDNIQGDARVYQAAVGEDPTRPPRDAQCTTATYGCLGDWAQGSQQIRQCNVAGLVCDAAAWDTRQNHPPNFYRIVFFPDGSKVIIQGGPNGGSVYIPPAR
jgi:hypothetical protein